MKKLSSSIILAASLAAGLTGCTVDKDYVIGKDSVDMGITLFQNGLEVPVIKNTEDIKVGDLVKKISDTTVNKLLKLGKDGNYEIRYSGHENMDSLISDLDFSKILQFDPVNFSQSFEYEFGELDQSKFKTTEVNVGDYTTMPDLSCVTDIKIPGVNESVQADAGLKGKDFDIPTDVDPVKINQSIFKKAELVAAGTLSPTQTVSLKDSVMKLAVPVKTVPAFDIPSDIEKINSVTLKSTAKLAVKLSVANNVFKSGTVTPDVKLDLSDLLVFEGGSGVLDLSSMAALTAANGFSSTKEFPIKGVNLEKLGTVKNIATTGSFSMTSMTADKSACLAAAGDLGIDISLSFVDFQAESVNCDIKEMKNTVTKEVDIKIDDIALPSYFKDVEYVTFTDASKVTVKLSASNLDKLAGISMKAETLRVTFPSEMAVSGDNVSNNVLTLNNVDLSSGKTATVKISKIALPDPVGGNISFAKKIKVTATCSAQGSVNTSDLKKLSGEDVSVIAEVKSALEIDDFKATIAKCKTAQYFKSGTGSFEVPENAVSYGTFTITPKGDPALTVDMTVPDLGELSISAGSGVKVRVPSFIEFGTITDPDIQRVKDTLIFKKLANRTYSIPIQKIVAKAVKVDGTYKVVGDYQISAEIFSNECTIGMNTARKVSKAKIGFNATVPSLIADKIALDSLSFDVNEKVDMELLKSKDIPDMLLGAGEVKLDDVTANMGIDVSGMPSLGGSSKTMVDLKVTLPSFVNPSTFDIEGEIKDGKFTAKPLALTGFDLTGYDFQDLKKNGESLKGEVKIEGRIFAEKPEVDLSSISGKFKGRLTAGISGPNDKIALESFTVKADYQVDTVISVPFGQYSDMFGDVQFKLPDLSAVIGMKTNLAIPVKAHATVAPVKDKQELASKTLSFDLDFPYSASPEKTDTVTNNLSINLGDLLDAKPDSLKIRLGLSTDKTRYCYVKPGAEYTLGLGYDISIPLRFEEGFKLELRDTLDLNGSLAGVGDVLADNSFGVKGDIESTLPVGATVTLEFLSFDEDTGIYSLLPFKKVETRLMEPNSKSTFEIVTGPETPGATLPEITHLRYTIVLDSDGSSLGPDNYLKISNIVLVLPEGVTINAK